MYEKIRQKHGFYFSRKRRDDAISLASFLGFAIECDMKSLFPLLAVGAAFFFLSCENSLRHIATPTPTEKGAAVSGKSYESLRNGHSVYMLHCAQCHTHRLPNTSTLPAWHATISSMAENAGLSAADEKDLQAYLGEFSDR